ncbi:hypothetical protein KIN20_023449 [Parelaphostrongylus tenuis]|uniref:TGF-beta family profile domain-containing protein n=1 Tax=Parelaphostrongylus tenuis TaxID=148309 RepID=A0AAD5MRN8_PARTN|nr:hypothetical protein KIN20_023449 [Parelaphostrongylus tenuis]
MIVLSLLVYAALRTFSSEAFPAVGTRELSEKLKALLIGKLDLLQSQNLEWKYVGAVSGGGKVGETVLTTTPNGVCLTMDRIKISDCFTYTIHPQTPALSAIFTMSLKQTTEPVNLTVTLYETSHWKTELSTLGRSYVDSEEIDSVRDIRVEILRNAKGWFNTISNAEAPVVHMLKVEVLANNRLVSYFDFFSKPPELDFSYFDDGRVRMKCDPTVECCLVPHYVNFTEIGWNKFIMYPDGFYANYCIGPSDVTCTHENPEVEILLNTARAQSELPKKNYACAPRSFAPLRILYQVGPNHTMKLRLDDMIAMTCSCIS